jgi:hypothetical protein
MFADGDTVDVVIVVPVALPTSAMVAGAAHALVRLMVFESPLVPFAL